MTTSTTQPHLDLQAPPALPAGPVRPPLVDATPEQVAQLRADLADGGIHL